MTLCSVLPGHWTAVCVASQNDDGKMRPILVESFEVGRKVGRERQVTRQDIDLAVARIVNRVSRLGVTEVVIEWSKTSGVGHEIANALKSSLRVPFKLMYRWRVHFNRAEHSEWLAIRILEGFGGWPRDAQYDVCRNAGALLLESMAPSKEPAKHESRWDRLKAKRAAERTPEQLTIDDVTEAKDVEADRVVDPIRLGQDASDDESQVVRPDYAVEPDWNRVGRADMGGSRSGQEREENRGGSGPSNSIGEHVANEESRDSRTGESEETGVRRVRGVSGDGVGRGADLVVCDGELPNAGAAHAHSSREGAGRVAGIDPGSGKLALVISDTSKPPRVIHRTTLSVGEQVPLKKPRVIKRGEREVTLTHRHSLTPEMVDRLAADVVKILTDFGVTRLAIEHIDTVHIPKDNPSAASSIGTAINKTAWVDCSIRIAARSAGIAVEHVNAQTWRAYVVPIRERKGGDGADRLATAVPAGFANWSSDSNEHERDAGGVVLWMLREIAAAKPAKARRAKPEREGKYRSQVRKRPSRAEGQADASRQRALERAAEKRIAGGCLCGENVRRHRTECPYGELLRLEKRKKERKKAKNESDRALQNVSCGSGGEGLV